MYVRRRVRTRLVLIFALPQILAAMAWATTVFVLYSFAGWEFLRLPFLPISTIGTAVAIYVALKNNSAYDRFWEARTIWGGVVNASRSWANSVLSYVYGDGDDARRRLVHRHLAWVNALRLQLRKTSRFAAWREKSRDRWRWVDEHASALRMDWDHELGPFLSEDELAATADQANPAAHLLRTQGTELRALVDGGDLDMFRQLEMMHILDELYALQGKCERIKNTLFPRQYAYFSRLFTWVFVALVPLGLLDVFVADGPVGSGAYLPAIVLIGCAGLVGWVFMSMELIGDGSEDPFERGFNDVPMNALSRSIEIDLRQMLGETDVPPPEKPVNDVLY